MKPVRIALCALACLSIGVSHAAIDPRLDGCSSVGYVAGGLSDEEREALAALAEAYPLQLVFAGESGNMLSDVDVTIEDGEKHTLVDVKGQGPWFFANLPPGSYRVAATSDGKTLSHAITIGEGDTIKINFYWP